MGNFELTGCRCLGKFTSRFPNLLKLKSYLPVLRAGILVFSGIFAAVINNYTSVSLSLCFLLQEEEDALKPLREKLQDKQLIQDVVVHRSHAVTVKIP